MSESAPWPGELDYPKDKFLELMAFVAAERKGHADEVYPRAEEMFAAFSLTPFDQVRVVLLGQDPYPNPGHAMGLSFSVRREVSPLPASLRNISTMMTRDGLGPLTHGDLTSWGKQGVLLLNTALTVLKSDAGSHLSEWEDFTDSVIKLLLAREQPMVFLLWGGKAQAWKKQIDNSRHAVVTAPHPTSWEPAKTRFLDSKSFSAVNDKLSGLGLTKIDWVIV